GFCASPARHRAENRFPNWRIACCARHPRSAPPARHSAFRAAVGVRARRRLSFVPGREVRAVCGRFTLTTPPSVLAREFQLDAVPDLAPRYNAARGQDVATIWQAAGAPRALRLRRWGLVPHWAPDPGIGARLVNARAESAGSKPAFRDALRLRRCLVPADGFYEWAGSGRGPRRPFHLALTSGALFAIAGLFERWRGEDGAWLESCTLLTVPPNDQVRPLHDRMPAILPREAWAPRPDPQQPAGARALALLAPWAGELLAPRPVGRRVNDVGHDDPECLAAPGLGPLFDQSDRRIR